MIQVGTLLRVVDKSGVVIAQCIKVFGPSKKRIAFLGDVILVSVKWHNVSRIQRVKPRWRKKYRLGSMHRALVVRSCVNYCRVTGIFVRFNENSVVIVNKRVVPVTNRVYGPILKEFCMRWPSLGCVTKLIV